MSTETLDRSVPSTKVEGAQLRFANGAFSILPTDLLNARQPTLLFGLPLANATIEDAASAIVGRAAGNQTSVVNFVNAHCVNLMRRSRHYSRALSRSDDLLPDGSGIRLAAKLAGKIAPKNLNGTDLFPALCSFAARENQGLFLLGGKPGIAAAVAKNMQQAVPGLHICGHEDGYWERSKEEQLIELINTSGASILLIGLGVPMQEEWIARNRSKVRVPVMMGVGGLFDYYSNRIPRAPLWLRNLGCEWIWRLMQEPHRLAGRYLIGNPVFAARAAAHAWHERGFAGSWAQASKRGLDLTIAAAAMMALWPIFALICLLIKLEDSGPVFFKQTRIGENGKPFRMWKFRSMSVNAESRRAELLSQSERDSVCFKMKRDPRITKIGSLIRRASLDELPQLINVIKGNMSIVGPRPALPQEVITYQQSARARLKGKPGITCIWQVSGRAEIPFDQQVAMDIRYLKRKSVWQDVKLIAKTVPAVLTGRGAY